MKAAAGDQRFHEQGPVPPEQRIEQCSIPNPNLVHSIGGRVEAGGPQEGKDKRPKMRRFRGVMFNEGPAHHSDVCSSVL
jgi:hypothetical protein